VEQKQEVQAPFHDEIGIDLVITDFATCSHHETFKNINKTQKVKKLEKSFKHQQRKPSRSYEQNKD